MKKKIIQKINELQKKLNQKNDENLALKIKLKQLKQQLLNNPHNKNNDEEEDNKNDDNYNDKDKWIKNQQKDYLILMEIQ